MIVKRQKWMLALLAILMVAVSFQAVVGIGKAVNEPPIAQLDQTSYEINEGEYITFDARSSYDPEGNPLNYRWDFENDGIWTLWSTDATARLRFWDSKASPIIRVKVSDGLLEAETQATVFIHNLPPSVDVGEDVKTFAGVPVSISARVRDVGNDEVTVYFDYGDGTPITVSDPLIFEYPYDPKTVSISHTFEDPGDYIVTVTVEDDEEESAVDTAGVKVIEGIVGRIQFCDESGNIVEKTNARNSPLYVKGTGFPANEDIPVYIVTSLPVWDDGILLSSLEWINGALVQVDSEGNIPVTMIWEPRITLGKFDVFVDINNNGVYDEGFDDVSSWMYGGGLLVVPEIPLGTIVAFSSCVIALAVFWIKNREPN